MEWGWCIPAIIDRDWAAPGRVVGVDGFQHSEVQMRFHRGYFRLWLVAAVIWIIGSTFWLLQDAAEFADMLVSRDCDIFGDDAEWKACNEKQEGPPGGGTWFTNRFSDGSGWLILLAPPMLLLMFGFVFLKVIGWITSGFKE